MFNLALRQAVLYALDSETIRLGFGNDQNNGRILHAFGSSIPSDFNEKWNDEPYYERDVEKAKELLEEAGYKPGDLTLDLLVLNETDRIAGCTIAQAELAEIGINVNINAYDQALMNTAALDPHGYDIMITNYNASDFIVNMWVSMFDDATHQYGTWNFIQDDPKLQELLDAAMEEHSEETIDAFHQYVKDMAYAQGLFESLAFMVAQEGISIETDGQNNLCIGACVFADDYVGAADR